MLGGSLASLFADGWGCVPKQMLFGLGLFSADEWGQSFPKWPPLEEHMLIIPEICLQCPSPTMSHSHSLFSQEIPQELQSGLTQIPLESLLCPETQRTCLSQKESTSPSLMELLSTSPVGSQCQILWRLLLPMPDSQEWEPDIGLRTLTPMGEPL